MLRLCDAADEGIAPVYHQGAAAGRQLLLPHGGEAGEGAQDGLLPRPAPVGVPTPLTLVNQKVKIRACCLEHHAPAE